MPVVPRIDNHPSRRAAGSWSWRQALRRRESRFRFDIAASAVRGSDLAESSRNILRGTGLMAGSPGGREGRAASRCRRLRPRERRAAAGAPARTVARTSAPWVTSGSSPVLDDAGDGRAFAERGGVKGQRRGRCPRGKVTSTGSGNAPVEAPCRPWRRPRRRRRSSSHSGGAFWHGHAPAIVRLGASVTAGGLAHDRARPHRLGPRSGAGKTTVTLAILAALRRQGLPGPGGQAGPDIDPAFHQAATGGKASISAGP